MIIYILKFSACLAIFILFYKLYLEKENMHIVKRFYLLGSILFSISIPLITFTSYVDSVILTQFIQDVNLESNTEIIGSSTIYLPIILWFIYGLGFFIFGFKFIRNLIQIIKKIIYNPKIRAYDFSYVLLKELVVPHTFLYYIFLNKKKYVQHQIPKEVLWHEKTHAIQKHSIDVLLIEILQIIFWFNPLIYFTKHLIKLNHEFLADQAVLNKGISTNKYQQTLINFSDYSIQPQLANAINYSFIKKRFNIMKTKTSNKNIWIRSLVILPLLAILIYSFSGRTIIETPSIPNNSLSQKKEFEQYVEHNTLIKKSQIQEGDINIYLNSKGNLLIKDNILTKNELLNELQRIKKKSSLENSNSRTNVNLFISPSIELDHIIDVKNILREFGALKVNIRYTEDQDKATNDQITEYNKLAKSHNNKPKEYRIIKLKDFDRLKYIYELMTPEQRKDAESFPKFPPPPPPPPSPSHDNNGNQSQELQVALKKYSIEAKSYSDAVGIYQKSKDGNEYIKLREQYKLMMQLYSKYEELATNEKDLLAPPPPPPKK